MSHVHEGPLATYSSLTDKNLAGYFANTRMRKHLRKAGLVNKRGELVSENQYRLNMARKEHKKHVKNLLAQAIVHKSLDLERTRQVEIRRKLEEIAKIELVRRVRASEKRSNDAFLLPLVTYKKPPSPPPTPTPTPPPEEEEDSEIASRGRKGDEEILPYLSPRESRSTSRPATASEIRYRPQSAPAREMPQEYEETNVIYVDEHGRRLSPDRREERPQRGRPEEIDTKHLYSLDSASLKKYALQLARIDQGEVSPYLLSPVPTPPRSSRGSRSGMIGQRLRVRPRTAEARSPYRERPTSGQVQSVSGSSKSSDRDISPKSTPKGTPRRRFQQHRFVEGTLMLHRQEPAMMHQGEVQTLCEITMKYHGPNLTLPRDQRDPTQAISIDQQHCGGNTLTVFKENLQPADTFAFISRRHRGFPFSLSIFVDGRIDCRISTCCEYRHAKGVKLGGKMGHFSLLKVKGATPCYKCKLNSQASPRSLKRPPTFKKDKGQPEQMQEEVIVVDKRSVTVTQEEDLDEDQNIEVPVEDEPEKEKVKHETYIEPENDLDLTQGAQNDDKVAKSNEGAKSDAKTGKQKLTKRDVVVAVTKADDSEDKYESDFEDEEDTKKENDDEDTDDTPREKYEDEKFEEALSKSSKSSSSSSSSEEEEEVDRNSVSHFVYEKKEDKRIIGLKEDEDLEEEKKVEKVSVKDTDSISDVNVPGRKIAGYSDDEEYPDGPKYDTTESYSMATKVKAEKETAERQERVKRKDSSSSRSSSSSSERTPTPTQKKQASSSEDERVIKVPSPPTEKRKSPSPVLRTRKSSSSSSDGERRKKKSPSPVLKKKSSSSSSSSEDEAEKKVKRLSPTEKRISPIIMEQQRRRGSDSSTSSVHISEPEEEVKKPSPPQSPPKSPVRSPPRSPPKSPPKSPAPSSSSSSVSETEEDKPKEKIIVARTASPDRLGSPARRASPERASSPFPESFAYKTYSESLPSDDDRRELKRQNSIPDRFAYKRVYEDDNHIEVTATIASDRKKRVSSSSSESESADQEKEKVQESQKVTKVPSPTLEKKKSTSSSSESESESSKKKPVTQTLEDKKSKSSSSSSSSSESDSEKKAASNQPTQNEIAKTEDKKSSSSSDSSDSSSESETEVDKKKQEKVPEKDEKLVNSPEKAEVKKSSSSSSDSSSSESEAEKKAKPPSPKLSPPPVVKPVEKKESSSSGSSTDSSSDSDTETDTARTPKQSEPTEKSQDSPAKTVVSVDVEKQRSTSPPKPGEAKQSSSGSSSSSGSDSSESEAEPKKEEDKPKSPEQAKVPSPPPPVVTPPSVVKPGDIKDDGKKPESSGSDGDSSDSSTDSSSDSSSEDEDDKKKEDEKKDEKKDEELEKSKKDVTKSESEDDRKPNVISESESDQKKVSIFASESEGDNMYGGHDPDNAVEGIGAGTSYLRKIGVKPGVSHQGSVSNLLEGKEDVELNGISLNDEQVDEVGQYIRKQSSLKTLSIRNGQLTDDQFDKIADSVIQSKAKVVMLNFSLNKLGETSAEKIVELITDIPTVSILMLHGNPIGDSGVKTLVDGLLDLHYAHTGDNEDTQGSPDFCKLKELDLGETRLSDDGAEQVSRLIEANMSMNTLYMIGNKGITTAGWKKIGKALRRNTTLENLSLDFNNLGDDGLAALIIGLRDNQTLKTLDLEGTGLTEEGGKKLVELLKCNTTILDIAVSPGNKISEYVRGEIRNYLGLNRAAAQPKPFK